MPVCEIDVQNHIIDNDANGIGWIKLDCLQECVENGNMTLNHHCQLTLNRFKKRDFDNPQFIVVKRKKSGNRNSSANGS